MRVEVQIWPDDNTMIKVSHNVSASVPKRQTLAALGAFSQVPLAKPSGGDVMGVIRYCGDECADRAYELGFLRDP